MVFLLVRLALQVQHQIMGISTNGGHQCLLKWLPLVCLLMVSKIMLSYVREVSENRIFPQGLVLVFIDLFLQMLAAVLQKVGNLVVIIYILAEDMQMMRILS